MVSKPKAAWSSGRGGPAGNIADDAGLGGIEDDEEVQEIHVPPRVPRAMILNAKVIDVEDNDEDDLMPPGSSGPLPSQKRLDESIRLADTGGKNDTFDLKFPDKVDEKDKKNDEKDEKDSTLNLKFPEKAGLTGLDEGGGLTKKEQEGGSTAEINREHKRKKELDEYSKKSYKDKEVQLGPHSGIEELAADAAGLYKETKYPQETKNRQELRKRQENKRAEREEEEEEPVRNDFEIHKSSDDSVIRVPFGGGLLEDTTKNRNHLTGQYPSAVWMGGDRPHIDVPSETSEKVPAGFPQSRHVKGTGLINRRGFGPKSTVFVWDLEDALIITELLSAGKDPGLYWRNKDVEEGRGIGKRWEEAIGILTSRLKSYLDVDLSYSERFIHNLSEFYTKLECDKMTNVVGDSHVSESTNAVKLMEKLKALEELYLKGYENLVSENEAKEWRDLYEKTNEYTDNWLSAGRNLLQLCCQESKDEYFVGKRTLGPSDRLGRVEKEFFFETSGGKKKLDSESCKLRKLNNDGKWIAESGESVNLVVSSLPIISTFAKLMLFRLNTLIDPKNVYSYRGTGKLESFERIEKRFKAPRDLPTVYFCLVGFGEDEVEASKVLGWSMVKVQPGDEDLRLPNLTVSDIKASIQETQQKYKSQG